MAMLVAGFALAAFCLSTLAATSSVPPLGSHQPPTMLALRRTLPTVSRRVSRCMSSAAEASDGSMTLNFNLPHETIYSEAKVSQVIVPGAAGEYGITADHVPIVAQLKPGVLQIMHEGAEAEKYFVAGGFSLTHENSVTVRSVPSLGFNFRIAIYMIFVLQ